MGMAFLPRAMFVHSIVRLWTGGLTEFFVGLCWETRPLGNNFFIPALVCFLQYGRPGFAVALPSRA
jgi:hypothetical protein